MPISCCSRNGASHEDREVRTIVESNLAVELAAMEPGHEDREDSNHGRRLRVGKVAAMEPGHQDREGSAHKWERLTCTGGDGQLTGCVSGLAYPMPGRVLATRASRRACVGVEQ